MKNKKKSRIVPLLIVLGVVIFVVTLLPIILLNMYRNGTFDTTKYEVSDVRMKYSVQDDVYVTEKEYYGMIGTEVSYPGSKKCDFDYFNFVFFDSTSDAKKFVNKWLDHCNVTSYDEDGDWIVFQIDTSEGFEDSYMFQSKNVVAFTYKPFSETDSQFSARLRMIENMF